MDHGTLTQGWVKIISCHRPHLECLLLSEPSFAQNLQNFLWKVREPNFSCINYRIYIWTWSSHSQSSVWNLNVLNLVLCYRVQHSSDQHLTQSYNCPGIHNCGYWCFATSYFNSVIEKSTMVGLMNQQHRPRFCRVTGVIINGICVQLL